ncbi:hypothetical protein ACF3OE_07665 [Capnocytophaga canis]|uniref:hypothetical protein n=1 Tax=Capnocytophaga canis TaxID=1848903 RepID=UPI00370DB103
MKIENGKLYYTYVYPTNEFLYALCWDGNEKEVGQGKVFPSVHVFAWDGTLKEIIELDVPVSYFCVNENKSLLFAIALNPDEFELELRKIELK